MLLSLFLFLLPSGAASLTVAADRSPAAAQQERIERAVERVDFEDLLGRRWDAARLRGRVVLIDFWATWCAPCLAELPRLQALRDRHARGDFEIVGVVLDSMSRRSILSWLNRNRIEWPQVHVRGGYDSAVARDFGVDRLPASVLLDRNGRVAGINLRGERLEARVRELLAASDDNRQNRRGCR